MDLKTDATYRRERKLKAPGSAIEHEKEIEKNWQEGKSLCLLIVDVLVSNNNNKHEKPTAATTKGPRMLNNFSEGTELKGYNVKLVMFLYIRNKYLKQGFLSQRSQSERHSAVCQWRNN